MVPLPAGGGDEEDSRRPRIVGVRTSVPHGLEDAQREDTALLDDDTNDDEDVVVVGGRGGSGSEEDRLELSPPHSRSPSTSHGRPKGDHSDFSVHGMRLWYSRDFWLLFVIMALCAFLLFLSFLPVGYFLILHAIVTGTGLMCSSIRYILEI